MDNSKGVVDLVDASTKLIFNDDVSEATFVRHQDIPSSFLDNLADLRMDSGKPSGDFVKAASIPVAIADKWITEGFNIFDANVKLEDIMKRLRREDMDHLIATGKRLF